MTTIGAADAKAHLFALLDRAARGETVTITRHGKPASCAVPATDELVTWAARDRR